MHEARYAPHTGAAIADARGEPADGARAASMPHGGIGMEDRLAQREVLA